MRIAITFLFVAFFFLSCDSKKEVSSYSLSQDALSTGLRVDTIIGNVTFGMYPSQVYSSLGIYPGEFYSFDVDGLRSYNFIVSPKYLNDSLSALRFTLYNYYCSSLKNDKFYKLFEFKYGEPAFHQKKDYSDKYYWFKGNLEIGLQILGSEILAIDYSDNSRPIYGYDVVEGVGNDANKKYYTKEYYDSIYAPSKLKSLDGI